TRRRPNRCPQWSFLRPARSWWSWGPRAGSPTRNWRRSAAPSRSSWAATSCAPRPPAWPPSACCRRGWGAGEYDAGVSDDCLFCRIVAGEIPATVVHETPQTVAFRDINPQAPTHVLVVTRDHYADAGSLARADPALAGALLAAAAEV